MERKSPHQAIVAFSGEHEYGGAKVLTTNRNVVSVTRSDRHPVLSDGRNIIVIADEAHRSQ